MELVKQHTGKSPKEVQNGLEMDDERWLVDDVASMKDMKGSLQWNQLHVNGYV